MNQRKRSAQRRGGSLTKQLQAEALDWLQIAVGTALIAALVLAAVVGHHFTSQGMY